MTMIASLDADNYRTASVLTLTVSNQLHKMLVFQVTYLESAQAGMIYFNPVGAAGRQVQQFLK
jgi:hypothetical protein